MNITFFGFAGAAQSLESGNTSFLVETDGKSVLIDASGDPVRHLARARRSVGDVDAIIITHSHTDHIYALPSLLHNMYMEHRSKPLALVGNAATLSFAHGLLGMFGLLHRKDGMEILWSEAAPSKPFHMGHSAIEFFPAVHSCPCLGLVVREPETTLVYSSDGAPNPLIEDLDVDSPVLIHEAIGLHEDVEALNAAGHSSARQAGTMAMTIGATILFVCAMRPSTFAEVERIRNEAASACNVPVAVPTVDRRYSF